MSELERIIHDNSNGLDYILVGEIYLPLIAVPEEKREIGFYGSLHRNYLKDYKSGLYSYLTLSGNIRCKHFAFKWENGNESLWNGQNRQCLILKKREKMPLPLR